MCDAKEGSSRPRERVGPFVAPLEKEPIPIMTILPSFPSTAIGRGDGGLVRIFPRNRHSRSAGTSPPPPFVVGYKWVRDDVLKYCSLVTFIVSVGALWGQLELAKLGDSHKMGNLVSLFIGSRTPKDSNPLLRI